MANKTDLPRRQITTLRTVLTAVIVVGAGLVLLWLSGISRLWKHSAPLQVLVQQLGGTLIVAVGLAILWELVGKRAFANEILEQARISTDLTNAGLTRVTRQYLGEVEWEEYFRSARKVDIVVGYARTWRRRYWDQLREVARRDDARLRVLLPDPSDKALIDQLAYRFSMTPEKLVEAIEEAEADYLSLRVDGSASISVRYHKTDPVFTCYRFDGIAVLTLYTHKRERQTVPTFVCKEGGTLYEFIRDEIEGIIKQSRSAEDPPGKTEGAAS